MTSAGGGKSAALTMKSYLYTSAYANIHVGLFRETYNQAKESLYYKWLEFIPEFCPKTGKRLWTWKESQMQFLLPNGSRVSLNYMQNYDDAQKYQGVEFDAIGVDELTKHDRKTIDFIITRLRSVAQKTGKTQFWSTSNPGSKGHLWVKKLYIDPTDNGTKRVIRVLRNKKGKEFRVSYRYIKSTLYDNPYYEGTDYEANLLEQPEHMQRLFLYGDWTVAEGQFLTNFREKHHIYEPGEVTIKNFYKCYIHMDWGHNDNYEIGFTFVDEFGTYLTDKELSGNRTNVEDVCDRILETIDEYDLDEDMIEGIILPHDMFRQKDVAVRDGKGDIIGETSAEVIENLTGLSVLRAPNRKGIRVEGWRKVHRLMYYNEDKLKKKYNNGEITFEEIRPRWKVNRLCTNLIEQILSVVRDPDNPEDIEDGQEDHAIDMLRYFAVVVYDDEKSPKPKAAVNKNCIGYVKQQLMEREAYDDLSPLYG